MKFTRNEFHRVTSISYFDIPDDDIVEKFGSLQRFEEIMSHRSSAMMYQSDPVGDEPTDDEIELFNSLEDEYGIVDKRDDWVSDRKGGYDVTWEINFEDDDE